MDGGLSFLLLSSACIECQIILQAGCPTEGVAKGLLTFENAPIPPVSGLAVLRHGLLQLERSVLTILL